jgi:hypothetical protein
LEVGFDFFKVVFVCVRCLFVAAAVNKKQSKEAERSAADKNNDDDDDRTKHEANRSRRTSMAVSM